MYEEVGAGVVIVVVVVEVVEGDLMWWCDVALGVCGIVVRLWWWVVVGKGIEDWAWKSLFI